MDLSSSFAQGLTGVAFLALVMLALVCWDDARLVILLVVLGVILVESGALSFMAELKAGVLERLWMVEQKIMSLEHSTEMGLQRRKAFS